jgi:predicted O-methyltransferase YrrM
MPSICTTILRKAGIQWWSPWWPYPAIRHLGVLIRDSWRVLEFGSGASTPWLASRAQHVVSLESNRDWYSRVQSRLHAVGYSNVDLRLREGQTDYATVDMYSQSGFDLVIVDGAWRDLCAQTAVRLVRPGGYIYLDNSDVPDPDHRFAVETLLAAATTVERFVGLCPGTIAVNQGLLVGVGGP